MSTRIPVVHNPAEKRMERLQAADTLDFSTLPQDVLRQGDVVDGLSSVSAVAPLSANQGRALRELIDASKVRLHAVLDIVVASDAPPTEVEGDRYILQTGTVAHADWDTAVAGDVVQFTGGVWVPFSPVEGMKVYVDNQDNKDARYVDDGAPVWELIPAVVTVHGGLTGLDQDDHAQYLTEGRAGTWLALGHETNYDHTLLHVQGTDQELDAGGPSEVQALDLRNHLDNADIHREINDAGTADTELWSASKINNGIQTNKENLDTPALFLPRISALPLTKNERYERNPFMFRDSTGRIWMAYVRCTTLDYRTGGDVDAAPYNVFYKTSLDGLIWTTPIELPAFFHASFSPREVCICEDDANNIHFFIGNGTSGSPSDYRYLYNMFTADGGITWAEAADIVIAGWSSSPAQVGHMHVQYANSKFYLVFQQRSDMSSYFSTSVDGVNFGAYVTLHATNYGLPKIHVDTTDNRIYVVSTKGSDVSLSISVDDGVSFTSTDILVGSGLWDPAISRIANGSLGLVVAPGFGADGQKLRTSVSADQGVTWTALVDVTTGIRNGDEYWDYWPNFYIENKTNYVVYTTEVSLFGEDKIPGNIAIIKLDAALKLPALLGTNEVANTSSVPGTSAEDALTAVKSHMDTATIHRQINDAGTSATELWSASKINTAIASSSSKQTVTVGAAGANFTTLNAAIDALAPQGGGTIEIIDDIFTHAANGKVKDVSNITFKGKVADMATGSVIFWNSGLGAYIGENVTFKNCAVYARPGSTGYFLTAKDRANITLIDSFLYCTVTALGIPLNLNNAVCKVYAYNTRMNPAGTKRPIVGDANSSIYAFNYSQIGCTAPAVLYKDASSTVTAGTPVTTTLIDKASGMSNDSTVVGTTVKDALETLASGSGFTVSKKAVDYTVLPGDTVLIASGVADLTFFLPAASTVPNKRFEFKNMAAHMMTISPNGVDTIDGVNSPIIVSVQYEARILVSDGTEWYIF